MIWTCLKVKNTNIKYVDAHKHAQTRIFDNEVKKGLYRDIDENY